jgi:hypothetical protein
MKTMNIAATTVLTLAALGVSTATAAAAPPTSHRDTTTAPNAVVADAHRTADPATRGTGPDKAVPGLVPHMGFVAATSGQRGLPTATGIDGKAATMPAGIHHTVAVVGPLNNIDATTDFDNAVGNMANELGTGIPLGALAGTIIGGGVGCVAGAAAGAALMPPIFLPGAAGGCLAGLAAGSAIGAAVGTVVVGVPVTIAGAVKFYNTLYGPGAAHAG